MKILQVAKNQYVDEGLFCDAVSGGETTLKTRLSIAYTDTGLKVRFVSETGGKTVTPFEGENVPVWFGDAVEFFLSPYGDEQWYFEMNVAPNGAFFNARIFNPDDKTAFSHAELFSNVTSTVKIEKGIWTTELNVPFSFVLKKGDEKRIEELPWRFNAYRIDIAREEYAAFSPTGGGEANFHVPSKFAKMQLI